MNPERLECCTRSGTWLSGMMDKIVAKNLADAADKFLPLRLARAAPDYNLRMVAQFEHHTVLANSDPFNRVDRAVELVVELEINAAELRMLVIGLATKQDVMVVRYVRRIGSAAHTIFES